MPRVSKGLPFPRAQDRAQGKGAGAPFLRPAAFG